VHENKQGSTVTGMIEVADNGLLDPASRIYSLDGLHNLGSASLCHSSNIAALPTKNSMEIRYF